MDTPTSPGVPTRAPPREWIGLRTAFLLSLVLHAMLAGSLATTGLGILPATNPTQPSDAANIFRPKKAVDFSLEVSRSPSDIAAHEKPLDLSITRREPDRRSETDRSRNVSRREAAEQAEDATPRPRLPERVRESAEDLPASASRLARTVPQNADGTPNAVPALPSAAATADSSLPSLPSPPSSREARDERQAAVIRRVPREVAVLGPAASATLPATRAEPRRPADLPQPHTATLPRRMATATAATPDEAAVPSPVAPPATAPSSAPARPRAMPPTRSAEANMTAQSAAQATATADSAANVAPATAGTAVAAVTRQRAADPSTAATSPVGSGPALPRSDVAARAAAGDAPALVTIPQRASGGGEGMKSGPDAGSTPRPGAGSPLSAMTGRRGSSAQGVASAASGGEQEESDGDGSATSDGGASASVAITMAGSRGGATEAVNDAALNGSIDIGGTGPPTRVALGTAVGGPTESAAVNPLAAGNGGRPTPARGEETGPAGATRLPAAPSFGRSGARDAARVAVSSAGSLPDSTTRDGFDGAAADQDEGLSTDGTADLVAALGSAGSVRRSGGPSDLAASPATPLQRVAAVALPSDTRVREIAAPFRKRLEPDRTPPDTDRVVERGLDFLRRAQQPDGRWRLGAYPNADQEPPPKLASDTAATGLALLSFLGAGHDHFDGQYRDTIRRGLEFLLTTQKEDGDLYLPADPLSNSCAWLYSHGIATMALCEAVGMTGDRNIRPAAERACRFIADTQHPARHGWRYTPRSDTDLSVSGWMLIALRSGELAGVPIDTRSVAGVRELLDAATIPLAASRKPAARFHYNPLKPEQRPSDMSLACMNALGTLMRLHTGWSPRDDRILENSRPLAALLPAYGPSGQTTRDCYLWYYASQVLVHTGGEAWDRWYATLVDLLSAHQEQDGPQAGSWDPLGATPDRWGRYGGRVYVTTLHLLTLEVPSRHLPTYGVDDPSR